jgi:hypothetical protein
VRCARSGTGRVRQSDTFGVGCGNACAQFLAATKLINPDATHPCAIVAGSYAHWWVGMNMPKAGFFGTLYCSDRANWQCTGKLALCYAPELVLEQIQVVDGVTLYKFHHIDRTSVGDHHNGCYQVRPCGTPDPSVEHEPLSFT